jgi:hypothetical protein
MKKREKSFVLFVPFCGCYSLTAYGVANVFDRFANLPSCFAEAFLHLPASIICLALGGEIIVVKSVANSLFRFTLGLIPFSFNFVSIR